MVDGFFLAGEIAGEKGFCKVRTFLLRPHSSTVGREAAQRQQQQCGVD
jgi:hypothetical protein